MAARVECEVARWFTVLNHIVWAKAGSTRADGSEKEALRGFFPASERIIFAEQVGADGIARGEAGYVGACDKLRGFVFEPLRAYLAGEWERAGLTSRDANLACGNQMAGHYLSRVQWALPTAANYAKLQARANQRGGDYLRREYEDLRREYEDLRREYEDLRREYEDLRRPFNVTPDVPYTDVWTFPTVGAYPGKHPCEKPTALLRHMIAASTRPGGVVFDGFAGTSSTGVAAIMEGRKFIGVERERRYFRQGAERLRAAILDEQGGPLFATHHPPAAPTTLPLPGLDENTPRRNASDPQPQRGAATMNLLGEKPGEEEE
jgi:site-specific DNA-methyltransferase (adenine-specific)